MYTHCPNQSDKCNVTCDEKQYNIIPFLTGARSFSEPLIVLGFDDELAVVERSLVLNRGVLPKEYPVLLFDSIEVCWLFSGRDLIIGSLFTENS